MIFRSTWMTIKINGVATNLFYTGVIGHPRCNVLKLVIGIPNLKQHNWSTKLVRTTVDAPFYPGYLFHFNFCWTLGPFMSRFEFGPRTPFVCFVYLFD